MKILVDEMPYFQHDCPFEDDRGACKLTGGRCEHFDPPCRERNPDECDGLMTLEAYQRKKEEEAWLE